MSSFQPLPKSHRALVVKSTSETPAVHSLPTPQPGPGSAVVRILGANVISYMRDIYNGKRQYTYPVPLVPGTSAIGRVAAIGPDAALLKVGDLVHVDCLIRGRDDPSAAFLSGIHDGFSEGSKKLMKGEWRDSTYAEYAKVPLETCDLLDEKRLLNASGQGLGYTIEDLTHFSGLLVPYGGLRDVALEAGETVIVAPATGNFGQAAVHVALAMGAGKVIAMGRNQQVLSEVAKQNTERIVIVPMTGNVHEETAALEAHGPIDVYFDISPPAAAKSTHLKACIMALQHSGRVSLMGGIREDFGIPHSVVMHWNLTIKGKWMYEKSDIKGLLKLVSSKKLVLGAKAGKTIRDFGLEEWDEAFSAAEKGGLSDIVVLKP